MVEFLINIKATYLKIEFIETRNAGAPSTRITSGNVMKLIVAYTEVKFFRP